MAGTFQNDFTLRREALRRERAEIAVSIAGLRARDEELVREDERLKVEAELLAGEPLTVSAQYLIAKLQTSESTFWRLVRNPAKGFPKPIYPVNSDPLWIWADVKGYIARHKKGGEQRH